MKNTDALYLTDLHIGSRWGLWNPNHRVGHGTIDFAANSVQMKLWGYWVDLCRRLKNTKPDLIFLLGDIIDRTSPYSQGESTTNSLNELVSCALSILRMVPRKPDTKVFGLVRADYHDRLYLKMSEQICSELGGKLYGTTGIFTVEGHSFRIYHGSTTAYIYLELVMGRRRTFAQEAIARKKLPEIEGIICGHSHRWLHMRTMWRDGKDFHIVLCPGWEGQTDFMVMKDPDKMIPEIGAVVGRFTRRDVDFECLRYPTPLGISAPVKVR